MRRIAVDRSHSAVLIIEGEPGAGKSVLLDLAVKRTRGAGHRVPAAQRELSGDAPAPYASGDSAA
ncbi:hypothetical protein [Streptomyces sp. NPDC056296]|uniref:hypothetical protein n=1 Tax=Streptomyces sp. NPDC056296 TaxID=3345775 RepID=UPI0035E13A02